MLSCSGQMPAGAFASVAFALHYARRKTGECRRLQCPLTRFLIRRPCPRPGYTHVVATRGPSRTIYLAGQLGMTPDDKFASGPGDFGAQAAQAFENLKLGLAAAGAGFEHIVKITVYFTDMANLQTYFEVRDRYVNTKAPPASTAVQISRLARDGALFEIEAIAVVPE